MNKQQQFLWAVQTIMLANAINLSTQEGERRDRSRHLFSATGAMGFISDALYAAERIPADVPADEAAVEWCGYMLDNIREAGDRCPWWATRG